MTHCSIRLEAPVSNQIMVILKGHILLTLLFIISRLFRMHSDILDLGWIELTTPSTKKHKFDSVTVSFDDFEIFAIWLN
ncbi:13932_t:CDS:2 [Funneliformis caledonium]|uniref:13932_t:CDS:1 n=1 Tax=Funneliformis caledonium TaxID=1117310 RepID=A0A9N9C133_9GLOM|nr:13932_t:CDS:2 [Funneliformis caledonium]